MKEPLTTQDVATALGVSPRRVQQLDNSGVLGAVRTPGGQRIFDAEKVERVREQRAAKKHRQALA